MAAALALAAGLGLLAATVAAAEVMTFCFENENVRPWRTARGEGLNFQLLDRVAARLKVEFRYQGLPWKRCLLDLKENRVAGAIGASFKAERREFGAYPGEPESPDAGRSLYADRYVVLRRRDSEADWDGQAFRRLEGPVAAQLGYSVVDELKARGIRVDDGAHGPREVLQKLLVGRVNLAVLLAGEAGALLEDEPGLKVAVEILPRPFVEKPYFLMLSHQLMKERPQLAASIWNAIAGERRAPAYRRLEGAAVKAP